MPALREAIDAADAVLIATPEYNASIPGVLKNALDWASRPHADNPLRSKPAAVVGASTGMFGAVWAQAETRKVLSTIGARVIDRELPVPEGDERFDADGALVDPEDLELALAGILQELHAETREQLGEIVAALVDAAESPRRRRSPRARPPRTAARRRAPPRGLLGGLTRRRRLGSGARARGALGRLAVPVGRSRSISVTAVDVARTPVGRRSRGAGGGAPKSSSSAAGFGGSGRWTARTRAPATNSAPAASSAHEDPPLDARPSRPGAQIRLVEQPPDEQQQRPAAGQRDRDAVAARQVERALLRARPDQEQHARPPPAGSPPRRT